MTWTEEVADRTERVAQILDTLLKRETTGLADIWVWAIKNNEARMTSMVLASAMGWIVVLFIGKVQKVE